MNFPLVSFSYSNIFRSRLVSIFPLGLMVLFSPLVEVVRAEDPPLLSGKEIPLHGVLATHDEGTKSLDVEIKRGNKTGLVENFRYDDQTVWLNQRKLEMGDIKVGDQVVVLGDRLGDVFEARTISVSPPLDESVGTTGSDKVLRGIVKEASLDGLRVDESGVVVPVNIGTLKGILIREKLDQIPDFKSRQALRLFHQGGRLVVVVVPE